MISWNRSPDTGNLELNAFLDDMLEEMKHLNRQGLATLTPVGETASTTYGANEQAMLTHLKNAVNGILENT